MKRTKSIFRYLLLSIVGIFLVATSAFAGTGGTDEFNELYEMLEGWTTGILGKTIALGAFLVGMGFSVVQQSLVPVAIGIGAAAALAYTPDVLNNVLTASIF